MNLSRRFLRLLIMRLRTDPPGMRSGRRRLRVCWTRTVLLGLALSALTACTTQANGHIRIVRSVFLERGQSVEPHALARTKDGGYVIAGRLAGFPWATRVNAQGEVQWRYLASIVLPKAGEPAGDSLFTGAVTLPDDSTLLCGYRSRGVTKITGLLTHISPHGRVLSAQTLYPNNDHRYVLNYLQRCVRWGRGVAVIGTTDYVWGHSEPRHDITYFWLLKLDDKGKIQWQKLIPDIGASQVLALPGRNLLLAWTPFGKTELVRLDSNGAIKVRGSVPEELLVVHPSTAGSTVLSLVSALSKPHLSLRTVNAGLSEVAHRRGDRIAVVTRKAYRLPDHALALFGDTTPPEYGGMLLSSIAWVSPDLRYREVFNFKPGSVWIADAVPTGKPGEFATVHQAEPMQRPFEPLDRSQWGIVLSFVRIQ